MEETGTIEFVRNAVIASVCGHSRGIGGKPCFRLLSERPRVRIAPGAFMETPQSHLIAVFSFISGFLVFQSLKVDVLEYVVFCLVRTDRRIIQTKYSVIADFSMPIHAEILLGAMFVKSLFS